MAQKALLNAGVLLTGNALGDHVKVLHVMTRRSLVALGTVRRAWRWMAKFRYCPASRRMALSAVLSKQFEMAIVV